MAKFRIGVLTGGGDTPSLNATLYGIALAAEELGGEVIGFRRGWAGALYPDKKYEVVDKKDGKEERKPLDDVTGEYVFLTPNDVNPSQGGSIILSSRTNLTKIPGSLDDLAKRLKELGISYFLPIGGDDTTTVTLTVTKEGILPNVKIMAVPKTIDNDNGIIGPDGIFDGFEKMTNIWTPGFPTSVSNGRVFSNFTYSTAFTHERVMWNEAMGRKAGFLSLGMGYLGLADIILVPEDPVHIEDICKRTLEVYKQKGFFYGVVSEGVINAGTGKPIAEDPTIVDTFGHAKLGGAAKLITEATKEYFKKHNVHVPYYTAHVPEYMYRGGPPTSLDRLTAYNLGYSALTSLLEYTHNNGHMAVLLWDHVGAVTSTMPLEKAVMIKDGKIVPRQVPIDKENPEKGFYDPTTKNITGLGREYIDLLDIKNIEFIPWQGEIYK